MCTMCRQLNTAPDTCVFGENAEGRSFAQLSEFSDAAASTSTFYTMSVGDTFTGTRATSGDDDWVEIRLVAGQRYDISLSGITLSDTYLTLFDSYGNEIAYNDDGGSFNYDSQLSYTASRTGTYYIEAGAYDYYDTGSYRISVEREAEPERATLDELARFLTHGYWGGAQQAFNTAGSNIITVDLGALTSDGQQLARWALDAWEMVADIEFREVFSGADIDFDDNDAGAYSESNTSGSTILSSTVNVGTDWLSTYGATIDGYAFQTYVHEIGHALGLGHQGIYNGNATYGSDAEFTNDSWAVSVMSYFNQDENTSISASYAALAGPMMADILAIQNLYGAPGSNSPTAGATVYGQGTNLTGHLATLFNAIAADNTNSDYDGEDMAFTIFDAGGVDLINLGYTTRANRINLGAEEYSNVDGGIQNLSIARGTVIENVTSGSGSDNITGNNASNVIRANGGADLVRSLGGNDQVFGGNGHDTVYSGAGDDYMSGGGGNDGLWAGSGNDSVYGFDGNDQLGGGLGDDRLLGGAGDDSVYAGDGADVLNGQGGSDQLWSGAGGDTVYGGGGNDQLGGGLGWDDLFAGNGADLIYAGVGNDEAFGGGGNDTIFAGRDNDYVSGGSGNDILNGVAGNDTINGGTGNDTMSGGTGFDTFVFVGGADRITDFNAYNANERINLSGVASITSFSDLANNHMSEVGNNVVINAFGGNTLTLVGIDIGLLDASDFIF